MKKILVLIACVLLMAGCSNAKASISNGNDAVVTLNNEVYTREELYAFMSSYAGSYFAVNGAQQFILDAEVPATEEMNKTVDQTLQMYQSMLGSSFESYLQSQGFSGSEEYREILLQNEQLTALYTKYVSDNYDTLKKTYAPRQIQLMKFDNETSANEALEAVKAGNNFAEVAQEKGSKVDGAAQLVTSLSSFETVVQYTISTLGSGSTSEVVANDDGSSFYIISVLNNDADALKDEAVAVIAAETTIADESIQHYFKEYDFTVYDIDLYNQIAESYADLLNQ